MTRLLRFILLSALVLTAACSMQGAIETMTSPEDRAFAQRFVADVRRGNEEGLKPEFDPELWAQSRGQLAQARPLFPRGEGTTRLIGYHVSTNISNGVSTTTKEFILVTTDNSHWTRTRFVTFAQGGPARVMEWNVDGFGEPPPELKFYEMMERIAPWLLAGGLIVLLAFVGLIWWLVLRSRRRAAAAASQRPGP